MKVYNEEKTFILTEYDLSKGYLKQDKIFVATHPQTSSDNGLFHYETIGVYPNGGKSIKKVWDKKPTKKVDAYDEYEDIMVYVPFSEKQLAEMEIVDLKSKLNNSDYKAIKFAEGIISETEYLSIKSERQNWRNRINELQSLYGL